MEHLTGLNTALGYLRSIYTDPTLGLKFKKDFWSSLNEYPIFFGLVAQYRPENIIECGTCNGASATVFATAMALLDIPGKIYTWDAVSRPGVDEDTNVAHRIVRQVQPFAEAGEILKTISGSKKLYFIDGDHTYEGCKADVETIKSLLQKEDVIVFHDWHHEPVAASVTDAFKGFNFLQAYTIPSKQGIRVMVYGDN